MFARAQLGTLAATLIAVAVTGCAAEEPVLDVVEPGDVTLGESVVLRGSGFADINDVVGTLEAAAPAPAAVTAKGAAG